MNQLLCSPQHLQTARRKLQEMRFEGPKEARRLMALAECNFRLAVHNDTPFAESVELLQEAIRLDGHNPKYAYHLGRLHFLQGAFRESASWFRLACCLTPTSHRIWVHVAILMRELNAVYRGDDNYEPNVLPRRAEAILKAVREGNDNIDPDLLDFVPPRSLAAKEREARHGHKEQSDEADSQKEKSDDRFADMRPSAEVKRYLNAKRCRWSGVDHLYVEQLLEGRPSQGKVKQMAPSMQRLAESAAWHARNTNGAPGRTAAFAILCTQWLVCGYPVETVRRLMQLLPESCGSASRNLLETVCSIFEADPDSVPALLAEAVRLGRLPPGLAALIHKRRLLWHPLEFRSLGAYRAARRLCATGRQQNGSGNANADAETDSEVLQGLITRLNRAIGGLRSSPPAPLKDEIPKKDKQARSDPEVYRRRFAAFEEAAARLEKLSEEGFRILKETLDQPTRDLSDEQRYSRAIADRRAADQFVQALGRAGETALERLNELLKSMADLNAELLGADFGQRQDACTKKFQGLNNLGRFRKVLKRVDKRLTAAGEQLTDRPCPCSAEWNALLEGVAHAVPEELPDDDTAAVSPAARFAELERVSEELDNVRSAALEYLQTSLDPAIRDAGSSAEYRQALADRTLFDRLIPAFQSAGEHGLKLVADLMDEVASMGPDEFGPDFPARREQCLNRLRGLGNLGNFVRKLRRIDKRIAAAEEKQETGEADASDWLRRQVEFVETAFSSPSPQADSHQPQNPREQIEAWNRQSQEFQNQLEHDWPRLKELVKKSRAEELDDPERDELAEMRTRFERMMQDSERCVTEITALRESGDVPEGASDDFEAALKGYREVLRARGRFVKNFKKLPEQRPQSPPSSKEPVMQQPAGTEAPQPSSGNGQQGRPQETSEHSELEEALRRSDYEIEAMFAETLRTFEPYPEWMRLTPAFRTLRRSILARQAELSYRLGRRRAARSLWNRMLREDRLDIDALKNIAICETVEGDISRSLTSWREYVEMLYLYDVLSGDPRGHASIRAEFHRAFGNAYAPAFLSAEFDHEWGESVDPASLIAFLSSPGRVRNFINHRLLEYLNTRFEFRSPTLVLGIKRIEAESLAESAESRLRQYVSDVAELLPGRVGSQFAQLADRTLEQVAARCRDTRSLMLAQNPEYPDEEKRQIQLMARLCDLKLKLVIAFKDHVNMVRNATSFEFLAELSRLDRLPLDVSPGLLPIIAGSMGLDEETLPKLSSILRENIIASLLKYLFGDDDDSAERPIRERQYKLLIEECRRVPELQEHARLIDMPASFFPQEVLNAIEHGPVEAALEHLRRWNDMYPALGGLAVLLADKLIEQKLFDEADERLERTRSVLFYEPMRRAIHYRLISLRSRKIEGLMEDENYAEAFARTLELVELDDWQPALPQNLLQLYLAVSAKKGRRHRTSDVDRAVEAWCDRARRLIEQSADENDPVPRPSKENLEAVTKAHAETKSKAAQLPA